MVSSVYKWLFLPVTALLLSGRPAPHPFHVSVMEINHNASEKTLEISSKIFTDDFEKVLAKNYNTKVDLINPPNKAAMDSLVKKYLLSHLSLSVNSKPVTLNYLGFEIDKEAAYGYIEVSGVPVMSRINVSINMMYDMFDDQVNIVHVYEKGERKSTKLNYPDVEAEIAF